MSPARPTVVNCVYNADRVSFFQEL